MADVVPHVTGIVSADTPDTQLNADQIALMRDVGQVVLLWLERNGYIICRTNHLHQYAPVAASAEHTAQIAAEFAAHLKTCKRAEEWTGPSKAGGKQQYPLTMRRF